MHISKQPDSDYTLSSFYNLLFEQQFNNNNNQPLYHNNKLQWLWESLWRLCSHMVR